MVLLVTVRGVRILLTGDVEPEAQVALARAWPGLRADVLKIPHHGSRFQDLDFLRGLGARVAVASAGEDNDYGHPSPETLDPLGGLGRGGLPHRPGRRPSWWSPGTAWGWSPSGEPGDAVSVRCGRLEPPWRDHEQQTCWAGSRW